MPRDLGFLAAAAAELRGQSRARPGAPPAADGWTLEKVGERLVEALRWADHAAGRTGASGMVGMRLPEAILSMEDRLALGWGLHEVADPEEERPLRVQLSAAQVAALEEVLQWPAKYLCPDHAGSARMVGLWAACRARKSSFDVALKARRTIAKATAYRLRDRGLTLISQGLDRDGRQVGTRRWWISSV